MFRTRAARVFDVHVGCVLFRCIAGIDSFVHRAIAIYCVHLLQFLLYSSTGGRGGATRGGAFKPFAPPEIFKTLRSNFDICRNFQRIKMKLYILIILKKYDWNFSLSCSLIIISLQDLS